MLTGLAAGVFTSLLIVQMIGTAFGSPLAHPTPAVSIIGDFLFDGAFVGAALYFTVVGHWMGRREFGYNRISWLGGAGAVVLAAICYYIVTVAYSAVFNLHSTDRLPSDLGVKTSTWAAIFTALFVCAVAPMAEEFFFRGFLFGVLRRMRVSVAGHQLGPWVAAVIVGLLFGLAHTGSASAPAQFLIPLGFLGFVLVPRACWRTGSPVSRAWRCTRSTTASRSGSTSSDWNAEARSSLLTVGALAVIAAAHGASIATHRRPDRRWQLDRMIYAWRVIHGIPMRGDESVES